MAKLYIIATHAGFPFIMRIQNYCNVSRGKMEPLNDDVCWTPVRYEAGFKVVLFCSTRHKHKKVCKDLNIAGSMIGINADKHSLYNVIGQQHGYLNIKLNENLSF